MATTRDEGRVSAGEVARLHALGAKVWMSAVPLDGYIEPLRSLAVDRLLAAHPDFVLTDLPVPLSGGSPPAELSLDTWSELWSRDGGIV